MKLRNHRLRLDAGDDPVNRPNFSRYLIAFRMGPGPRSAGFQ
jgi:hypothetical protein